MAVHLTQAGAWIPGKLMSYCMKTIQTQFGPEKPPIGFRKNLCIRGSTHQAGDVG